MLLRWKQFLDNVRYNWEYMYTAFLDSDISLLEDAVHRRSKNVHVTHFIWWWAEFYVYLKNVISLLLDDSVYSSGLFVLRLFQYSVFHVYLFSPWCVYCVWMNEWPDFNIALDTQLTLVKKKTDEHNARTKPKPQSTGPISLVRTVHMTVHITVHYCSAHATQHNSDNRLYHHSDNHHWSVYCVQRRSNQTRSWSRFLGSQPAGPWLSHKAGGRLPLLSFYFPTTTKIFRPTF